LFEQTKFDFSVISKKVLEKPIFGNFILKIYLRLKNPLTSETMSTSNFGDSLFFI